MIKSIRNLFRPRIVQVEDFFMIKRNAFINEFLDDSLFFREPTWWSLRYLHNCRFKSIEDAEKFWIEFTNKYYAPKISFKNKLNPRKIQIVKIL